MSRFSQKPEDQREPQPPAVSRRVMLIASGGLMLGVAGVVGCAGERLQAGTLGPGPVQAGRTSGAAQRKQPQPASTTPATARTTGARATPHPTTAHKKPDPHPTKTATDGPPPPTPVYYVDDGPMTIALTIDDGPSPIYTPQILQILDRYHVTASFSMVGENVTYYPSVAREVADAGHVIVNHTWDHADLAKLTESQTRAEIGNAADAIHHAVGRTPTIFRAPYGAWSRTTLEYCASENLMPLDWSVDPRDWARPGVKEIVGNIMKNTETGSIILEHDGGGDRSETVAALKIAIPRLLDRGYHFKPV
jgi:peptidoglycan/xylan/chitin deacetylase (PgdA/CDA1 family)